MELFCTSIITISMPVSRVFVSFVGCVVVRGRGGVEILAFPFYSTFDKNENDIFPAP
jgi:hypothetical protein